MPTLQSEMSSERERQILALYPKGDEDFEGSHLAETYPWEIRHMMGRAWDAAIEAAAKVAEQKTSRMSVDYFPPQVGEKIAQAIRALGGGDEQG